MWLSLRVLLAPATELCDLVCAPVDIQAEEAAHIIAAEGSEQELLPCTGETVRKTLQRLLDDGDAQHFVAVIETIRGTAGPTQQAQSASPVGSGIIESLLPAIMENDRARESYLSYIGMPKFNLATYASHDCVWCAESRYPSSSGETCVGKLDHQTK
jgi:hypothetical protein